MRVLPLLCALVLVCSGCSQNRLLTKQDYETSQQEFLYGHPHEALEDFPRGKEDGDFITTVERGYLSLLDGTPQRGELQRQAAALENRVRYHVSREARTFFYVQTPEDYYASEHEVIWLHFLLSWSYSREGKYQDACVEARQASTLLSLPWSPAGHFDDPAMRLMLASLWTMCGEWREARVDLRAAWSMDNSLTWAKSLAEREKPPAQLFVVLGGPGPEPLWNPDAITNPLRAERQIHFRMRGVKSDLSITDQRGNVIKPYLSPDASRWYERHQARESELHELILDSAYGGKVAANGAWAGSKIVATTGFGVLVAAGGTALGVGIIYAGAQTSSAVDAVKLGVMIIAVSIGVGANIAEQGYKDSMRELKRDLDPSPSYRFVRYLPEYLWLAWSDEPVAYPVRLKTSHDKVMLTQPGVGNGALVSIAYVPDVGFGYAAENVEHNTGARRDGAADSAVIVRHPPCEGQSGRVFTAAGSFSTGERGCPPDLGW